MYPRFPTVTFTAFSRSLTERHAQRRDSPLPDFSHSIFLEDAVRYALRMVSSIFSLDAKDANLSPSARLYLAELRDLMQRAKCALPADEFRRVQVEAVHLGDGHFDP